MSHRTRGRASLPRHARTKRRPRHRLAVALVGVLAFVLTGGGAVYADLQSNVNTVDVGSLVDRPEDESGATRGESTPPPDPNAGTALTLLVIGSDSRADGAAGDAVTSVLADTHLIVHISADRSRVDVVSIPRDVMVQRPECRTTSGERIWGGYAPYNSAFAEAWLVGGDIESAIACDINLAQASTGLTMDGFVLVEMGGFVNMVDALGGVNICIPEPIDAPKAHLELEAGQQVLNGTQALGYARARVGVGDGSDTGRIERQQRLMAAMMDQVLSSNLLTDGPALYQMLSATLSALTVSENLSSVTDMAGLALSLRGLEKSNITFVTTPFGAYRPDPNRLVWTSAVDQIWEAIAVDQPLPASITGVEEPPDEDAGASGSAGQDPAATAPPANTPDPADGTQSTEAEVC